MSRKAMAPSKSEMARLLVEKERKEQVATLATARVVEVVIINVVDGSTTSIALLQNVLDVKNTPISRKRVRTRQSAS
ncbi:hypothetical protein GYH30_010021 [Glycine max]|nr:hypothetical protein GYH30_010021 [Glycine max]